MIKSPVFSLGILLALVLAVSDLESPTQTAPPPPVTKQVLEYPTVNLPEALRTKNWGGGSCVHASVVTLFRWQNRDDLADYWRANFIGAESFAGVMTKANRLGLSFVGTSDGSVAFLELCCRTRRGAMIFYYPKHAVNLVHLDSKWAGLLDNNRTHKYIWIPRDVFIQNWRSYGGVAATPTYSPVSPIPYAEAFQ